MHRKLLTLTRHSRTALILTILSGFLAGLLTIWQSWLLSQTIDQVFLKNKSLQQVGMPLLLMLTAIGGRAILTWVNEVAANAVAVKIKTDLRSRLFTHIMQLGPAYSRQQRTGELTAAAVEGIEALDAYFSQYLPQLVITSLIPISILVFVFPIDLLSGIVFLVTAPLIPFFMIMIGKGAEAITKRQYDTLRLLSAHFLDSLQGLTTLKLFGQSRGQARTIAQVSEKFRDTTMGVLRITFLSALALELLATLSTAIIAVEIGFRLLYAKMEFQPALFLLVLAPEFYMPLRALGARFHAGMNGTTAARRIYEILDTPLPKKAHALSAPTSPKIEIEDLSFTYPGETQPALQSINLKIKQGQHIALVGRTGAGKSTLIQLLLGFIQPGSGSISIPPAGVDGAPARLAWVPQTPHLFHDTIAANIRMGKTDANQAEVINAARAASLHDFIESLPDKYETMIGEGGARLSGGQAQRLALARAFIRNAEILLLDEPTSSLDPQTEAALEHATRSLMEGRTVITIAHRLNTIFQADQIVVLENGRLIEQGTHHELLALGGLYASMVASYDARLVIEEQQAARALQSEPAAPPPVAGISENSATPDSPVFWRLLQFLQDSWARVGLSVAIGSLTVGASVALMGTSAWLISTAALHPSVADLGVSVVGVRFFGITRGIARYFERLVSHDVTFRLLSRLRVWFYEKLEPLAPARLMEFRAGDLLARVIGDVETLENFYVRVVSPPLTAGVIGLLTALFLAFFNPILVPAFLFFFLSLGLLLPILARHFSQKPAKHTIRLRSELHARLVDGIQGMADLIAYEQAGERLRQIHETGDLYGKAQQRMARVTGFHSSLTTLLTNLGLWVVLVLSIPKVTSGALEGPMLASLALLTFAAFEAVMPLPAAAQMWNASRAAALRLFEVVDSKPTVAPAPGSAPKLAPPTNAPAIRFSSLTFQYPNQPVPAVRDIYLDIPAGAAIAIVGPSGAGKSTLANLLLRFWEFDSGEISLGGIPLRTQNQDDIRARIGVVSQNSYFFNTSIRENLRFARRKVQQDEIEAAAKAAQIHDFIIDLPKGYDTMIGEQGLRLSGGERQRLAIARAVIKNAPILLLDEPTANLDTLTETRILQTLFGLMRGKTTLLITHRLVGLEHMDEINVMDTGAIVEHGKHERLLAQAGLYHRLWRYQNRIFGAET